MEEVMKSNPQYAERHYNVFNTRNTDKRYPPISLRRFSPYEEVWECGNIPNCLGVKKGDVEEVDPQGAAMELEEAYEKMREAMTEAFNARHEDTEIAPIDIIKGYVGLGKSALLLELDCSNCVLAFSTHKKKEEMSLDFEKAGIPHLVIPDCPVTGVPICDEHLEFLKKSGVPSTFFGFLELIISNEIWFNGIKWDIPLEVRQEFLDYRNRRREATTTQHPVITTHANVLYNGYAGKFICYDEDPISSYWENGRCSFNSFMELGRCEEIPEPIRAQINEIVSLSFNWTEDVAQRVPAACVSVIQEHLDELNLLIIDRVVSPSVKKLFFSDWCSITRDWHSKELVLSFIKAHRIPADQKCMILSATCNEALYQNM